MVSRSWGLSYANKHSKWCLEWHQINCNWQERQLLRAKSQSWASRKDFSRLSIRSQSKPPRYIEPWHVWIFDLLLLLKAFVSACFWHEWVLRMPVCGWSNMQNCMVNNLRWMGVCICPMDGNPNTMPCMLLSARKKIFLDWISDRLHKWRSLKFGGLNAHTSK